MATGMAMASLATTLNKKEYLMIAAILSCLFSANCLVTLRNYSVMRFALSKLDKAHSKLPTVTIYCIFSPVVTCSFRELNNLILSLAHF